MTPYERDVNKSLEEYETWFRGQGNAPLTPFEKAAVKNFLWFAHKNPETLFVNNIVFRYDPPKE
jgi:hypothetical protein